MTVIAWDGKTMAADRLLMRAGSRYAITKICSCRGALIGCAGDTGASEALMHWFAAGAKEDDFPLCAESDGKGGPAHMLVVEADGAVLEYDGCAFPMRYDRGQYVAIGRGADFARAAMHLGKTAAEAVQVACDLCISCGGGVDVLAHTQGQLDTLASPQGIESKTES